MISSYAHTIIAKKEQIDLVIHADTYILIYLYVLLLYIINFYLHCETTCP